MKVVIASLFLLMITSCSDVAEIPQVDRELIRYFDREFGIVCYKIKDIPSVSCIQLPKDEGDSK